MKAISVAAILLLATSAASAQTTEELNNDGRNTDNVLTYGMGYHQQRYSRLKYVNKNTVKPGMVVVVDGYQARDGSRRANGRDVTLPEGRRLFLGSGGTGAPGEPSAGSESQQQK
jgi:opacity protein-like surface antigen